MFHVFAFFGRLPSASIGWPLIEDGLKLKRSICRVWGQTEDAIMLPSYGNYAGIKFYFFFKW